MKKIILKNPKEFELFWGLYDNKVGRKKCELIWNRLTEDEINASIRQAPRYAISTPDKRYRKHPATWLNGECWNDEIILSAKDEQMYLDEKKLLSRTPGFKNEW